MHRNSFRKTAPPNPVEGILTSLETQSARSDRVSVFVNGVFFCGLSMATAARLKLKKGLPISYALSEELIQAAALDFAWDMALRSLAKNSQSATRLSRKLSQAGIPDRQIELVIARLLDQGLLDDLAYAKSVVHDLSILKKFGRIRIQSELRKRGIEDDIIRKVLPESDSVDLSAFVTLVRRRYGAQPDTTKVSRFLQYRGLNWTQIHSVLKMIGADFTIDE